MVVFQVLPVAQLGIHLEVVMSHMVSMSQHSAPAQPAGLIVPSKLPALPAAIWLASTSEPDHTVGPFKSNSS